MGTVMAVFDFHGDTADLTARYDKLLDRVVEVSPARPVIHLAVPREYGLMVCDVWDDEGVLRTFVDNPEFHRVLEEFGMPDPQLRIFPVHNLGWPFPELPLYR
jgi:hypothetical protein